MAAAKPSAKRPAPVRTTLKAVMAELEAEGTAQARKTYARHGAEPPMFGTSFATLFRMMKRIGVDHDLALQLWETGNFDARNLAFKVADPAKLTAADLDRWARDTTSRMCGLYVSMLAAEGPQAMAHAKRWLASREERLQCAGWGLVQQMAGRHPDAPDAWFTERLRDIEAGIHGAADAVRAAMNTALITIGGRSAALRKSALAASKRIGRVEVDHGDTDCKTPHAPDYIAKMWAHSEAKGFASPSAQEMDRKPPRLRC